MICGVSGLGSRLCLELTLFTVLGSGFRALVFSFPVSDFGFRVSGYEF